MTSLDKKYFSILPEVAHALNAQRPVVALESTVITHGLPYPENIKLAADVENEVRKAGCIPATIAIIDGMVCVGLGPEQFEKLVNKRDLLKISTRDIAFSVTRKRSGGTTVAATLAIAQEAGIKVFATGGIGGVHRDDPFDISADLGQLAKSRLVVVCAGAKAILDIPATLEVLETYAVPVVGYQTDEFPAFYSVHSGMPVGMRCDTAAEVAALAQTHWDLGMHSAILVGAPPPTGSALKEAYVEEAIRTALKEAQDTQVRGQAVTPFLLKRVSELTGGDSLQANLALLMNNARVAAEIASCMKYDQGYN